MIYRILIIIVCVSIFAVLASIVGVKMYNSDEGKYSDEEEKKATKVAFWCFIGAVISVVAFIFLPWNAKQVNTGEIAVVKNKGVVVGVREPGVYWDFWMTNHYEIYDTKVQEIKIDTQAYSKDNQIIGVNVNLQYVIDSSQVEKIATTYGDIRKLESKITSISYDNIKSVFAQNTATEIITNRATISTNISKMINNSVNTDYYVNIKTVVLTNIDFTDDFEAAVAAKVAQEQKMQQALIEQEQQLAEAENNKKIAITNAEAEAQAAKTKAEAEAEVARIKAEADQTVAQIEADTAEYAGKKNAAIAIQKLASVNGWTVVQKMDDDGNVFNQLYKPDMALVTADELQVGVTKLMEVYKYEAWDGKLPTYQMGENGGITVTMVNP